MARFCQNCGAPLVDGAAFCPGCGTPAAQQPEPAPQKRCANCGAVLAPGEAFCAACGTPAAQQPEPAPQKRCANCGAVLAPGELFCAACGQRADAAPQTPAPQYAPQYAQQHVPQPAAPAVSQQKKGRGLLIGLLSGGVALIAALVLIGGFVWPGFFKSDDAKPANEDTVYTPQKPTEKPAKPTKPTAPTETKPVVPTQTEPTEPTEFVNPFTDLEEDDYVYDAFVWAYRSGIVSGGEAKPEKSITRAEAVTFLWRSQGSPEPALRQSPFTDLNEDKFYYRPVLWAYEQGIVSGSGEFKPNDMLTTAQALTFINRMMGSPTSSGRRYFIDVPEGKWYFEPIGWAVENGIADYYSFTFWPEDETWREDFILWLARTMGADVEEAWYQEPETDELLPIRLTTETPAEFYATRSKDDFTPTALRATVVSYDVFTEADGFPTPEPGYEYRRLQIRVDGVDDSANHGNYVIWMFTDYYYPDLNSETAEQDDNEVYTAQVYYQGKFLPITYWQSCDIHSTSGNMAGSIYAYTVLATVPQGYDGVVFGLRSPALTDGDYSEENNDSFVFVRLD